MKVTIKFHPCARFYYLNSIQFCCASLSHTYSLGFIEVIAARERVALKLQGFDEQAKESWKYLLPLHSCPYCKENVNAVIMEREDDRR